MLRDGAYRSNGRLRDVSPRASRRRRVKLADVDDRECGACHRADRNAGSRLTTLSHHPEFAMVRAGTEVGTGLRWFNHQAHLLKVTEKLKEQKVTEKPLQPEGCAYCHERTPDAASFKPIVFAGRCAACHEEDLAESASSLSPAVIAALGPLPPPLKLRADPDNPDRQAIIGIKHADPWVLRTVQRLRLAIDPSAFAAERVTLDREVAQLELMERFPPADAGAWIGAHSGAAAEDRSIGSDSRALENGLRETAQAVESLAKALVPLDGAAKNVADQAARLTQGGTSPGGVAASAATPAANIQQLTQLLDATIARATAANHPNLADRATALKARVDKLPPAPRSSARGPDDGLEALLRNLRAIADPGVRSQVRQLERLDRIARQLAVTGIDPTAFDQHRQQTFALLDSVQAATRRASDAAPMNIENLRARSSALRRDVLATDFGLPADVSRARARFFGDRQSDRARVDTELDAGGLRRLTASRFVENLPSDRALDRLRRRLEPIGSALPLPGTVSAMDARAAIAALLGQEAPDSEANGLKKNRCTLCHELTAAADQLAPIGSPGGSLLVSATFTHKPHAPDNGPKNCVTCHTGVLESTAARDLNIPGVDSCRTCHAPGKKAANSSGCESCHKYHAPPRSAFMWQP